MSIVDLVRNTAFSAAIHTALEYLESGRKYSESNETYGSGTAGWMV